MRSCRKQARSCREQVRSCSVFTDLHTRMYVHGVAEVEGVVTVGVLLDEQRRRVGVTEVSVTQS